MSKILPLSKRQRVIVSILFSVLILAAIIVTGSLIGEERMAIQLASKHQAPSLEHPFGTDWLGRDMLVRTVKGLTISMGIGVLAAFASTIIAFALSILSILNKTLDRMVTSLIDLFLSVPHIVMLLLLSFVFGGGYKGVIIGLSLTHWPSLTRLLRSELLQIKSKEFVTISYRLGKKKLWIIMHHFIPHVLPQMFVGFLLLFPHAILHEAAITFLGFGLPPEQPAIGIILAESMRYLSVGMWWLALFPGFSLVIMVTLFDALGKNLRVFIDPFHS
ncbi:Dipeptide transport system permease protein DppC [Paraliobacillus sp. PM-2]|uniref:ABC transporter permease n=1 Tax=Paraliobacillus sp. PM-2 TaxID=1462524 RepID=UPI00061BD210|nr:ABC transporter permease [Paraliobacillus sp. PM-2]CQR47401.1 Dipeptide transport system permease protein DppC [Paraliobacillus sp. PM-2]